LQSLPAIKIGRIIFVDQRAGKDTHSGRVAVCTAGDGPKKTIRAGLESVEPGGHLIIKEGSYGENLDIAGKDIHVEVDGYVDLSGPRSEEASEAAVPVFDTGSVTNK
jgi:hypothetical protein